MSRAAPKKKRASDRPAVPMFRDMTPPGYVLVERHLRKKPPKKGTTKKRRR